jgi:two-component system chemotaxis response regulator CheY
MRRIIIKILKNAGYKDMEEAGDGAEAMTKMNGVGLILLDWNLPVMDGLAVAKEIRRSPVFMNIPIIMVTTEGSQKEILEAFKQGVNDFIVKPFTQDLLIKKVAGILRNQ